MVGESNGRKREQTPCLGALDPREILFSAKDSGPVGVRRKEISPHDGPNVLFLSLDRDRRDLWWGAGPNNPPPWLGRYQALGPREAALSRLAGPSWDGRAHAPPSRLFFSLSSPTRRWKQCVSRCRGGKRRRWVLMGKAREASKRSTGESSKLAINVLAMGNFVQTNRI